MSTFGSRSPRWPRLKTFRVDAQLVVEIVALLNSFSKQKPYAEDKAKVKKEFKGKGTLASPRFQNGFEDNIAGQIDANSLVLAIN
ncbi:MAG: hypothetical protein HYU39_03645 [Thaumarchaeota archaeon]|nr:hypothetical protein [Nitrososphaerota archaeon]